MKTSLSLIGFMGSGKTTIGKRLSLSFNIPFLDLDDYIEEKLGKKISEIFREEGEEYFRDAETTFLKEVFSLYPKIILSTGGGIVLREENRKILKEKSKVIYLKGEFENLMRRLEKENEYEKRPLLKKGKEEVYNLWKSRLSLYEASADFIVEIDNKSIEEVFNEVLKIFEDD